MDRVPPWIVPAAVLVVAFALRAGLQILVGFYVNPVRWEYDTIARNLFEGRGYSYDFLGTHWLTFGLPALPLLDAALYTVTGGTYLGIGVTLALVSAATAAITAVVALQLHGRLAAALAGAAVAFHPGELVYSSQIHELPLEAFALATALVALMAEMRRPSPRTLAAAALCSAFATFVRPTYGAFVLVALLLIAVRRPAFAWRRSLLIVAAMVLLTLPWTIRTTAVLGESQGSLPYSCLGLWIGNNPYAPGSSLDAHGQSWWDVQPEAVKQEILGKPEAVQGRIFCDQTAAFLTADPVREIGWWIQKASWYWWISPQAGQLYPTLGLRVYLALWSLAALLAVVGAAALWYRRRRGELAILLSLYVPISAAQSFAYVDGRHRLEIEWAVLILSAIGIVAAGRAVAASRVFARGPGRLQVSASYRR